MANPSDELKNIFSGGGGLRLKKVGPPKLGEEKEISKSQTLPIAALKPPLASRTRKPKLITKAEAEFDYAAEQDDELSFEEGDIFVVHNKTVYDGWALGEKDGKKGVFPNNFVRFFEEEEEPEEQPKPMQRKTSGPPTAPPSGPPVPPPSGPPAPPPSTSPPSTGPPSSGPNKGPNCAPPPGPPSLGAEQSRHSVPLSETETDRSDRSGSVAARAAFLSGALAKSGTRVGGTASPSRNLENPNLGNPSLEQSTTTKTKGFTAEELRNFALEHRDEIKPVRTAGPDGKRKPAAPETVISPSDVRTKISSSRRRESVEQDNGYKPERSESRPDISSTPPPSVKMSLPPVVQPPIPRGGSDRKPLPATPVLKPATPEMIDPISEGSDMYMEMDLENNDSFAALKIRIESLETANKRLGSQVEELEKNSTSSTEGSSVSGEELSAIMTRLEACETATARTNKLIALLQGDLDEEINTRKQLETEVTKLRRTVKLLQG
ncbi:hypothetical protein ACHWQZ_G005595 [Mnemiopsis leidyi]